MNAAVFAYGMMAGGRDGARASLEEFWKKVSNAAAFSPFQRSPLDRMLGRWSLDYSPTYIATDLMARLVSPYSLGGRGANPLRDILNETIDFKRLAQSPDQAFHHGDQCAHRTGPHISQFRNHRRTSCWRPPACRRCFRRS